MRKAVIMEVRKAEIKDLDIVVQMKMDMFKEVGSVTLLQENAESKNIRKIQRTVLTGKMLSLSRI